MKNIDKCVTYLKMTKKGLFFEGYFLYCAKSGALLCPIFAHESASTQVHESTQNVDFLPYSKNGRRRNAIKLKYNFTTIS